VHLDGYFINRNDRNSFGGGLITYIKSEYKPSINTVEQEKARAVGLETTITTIRFAKKDKPISVIGVYRPPHLKLDWFNKFNDLILRLAAWSYIIVMGDLKADLLKPLINPGKTLRLALKLAGVKVYNKAPTRITSTSSTCLDIIAIDKGLVCVETWVGDELISDHLPSCAIIQGSASLKVKPILKRDFKRMDKDQLKRALQTVDLEGSLNVSVDERVEAWSEQITKVLDTVAPFKQFPCRMKKSPFITKDIEKQIHEINRLTKKL